MRRPARPLTLLCCLLGASLLCACEDKATAAMNRGNQAAKSGKLADAASSYEAATKASPENAHAYELLGHAYFELGRQEDARRAYENALQRAPSSVPARVGLARLDGLAGKTDAAIAQLTQVIATSPDDVLALTSRAALSINRGGPGDVELALSDTRHALELSPDDGRTLYVRGNALLAQKNFPDAQAAFERLGKVSPDSPLSEYGLARVAAAKADRLSALTHLRTALDKAKGQPGLLPPAAVRADPAFHFLQADADFAQLVPAP